MLPLVAVVYSSLHTEDPPLMFAEAAQGACRLAWVFLDAAAVSPGAQRLLRGLGEIIDVTGLPIGDAAERLREAGLDGITCFNDHNLVWTAEVADMLGLTFFSATAARRLTDKLDQRRALRDHGLPTPAFWDVDDLSDDAALADVTGGAGFPLVLKPRRGRSSADVEAIGSEDALRAALARTAPGRMLLEGFIPDPSSPVTDHDTAPYVSVELAVSAGTVSVLGVTGKPPLAPPFRETGHLFPADLPDRVRDELVEAAIASSAAIGVENGALHVEIKYTDDGPVVIEVNGCMGGGPLRDLMIQEIGVDIVQVQFLLAAGRPASSAGLAQPSGVGFYFQVQVDPSIRHVDAIEGLETLADIPGVTRVIPGLRAGDDFDWRTGTHVFAAALLGTAPDHAAAHRIRRELAARVVVTGR